MSQENILVKPITDDKFEEIIKQAKQPVLVDFYADWCGPCKMAGPIIDKLAQEYAGKVAFFKLNIDDNQTVPASYGVMSIPSVMIFSYQDNEIKILANQVGFVGEAVYKEMLEQALKQ